MAITTQYSRRPDVMHYFNVVTMEGLCLEPSDFGADGE